MTDERRSRADVVAAAGRLFAERGYHGTSMRDLGRDLGLVGSSLYSHIGSKEELLVEVVRSGARLFQESAEQASTAEGSAAERLRALIVGHIGVMLDHRQDVGTYLNEASALEETVRRQVIESRNGYEEFFRTAFKDGVADGSIVLRTEPRLAAIFLLSILNAIERWYRPTGRLTRQQLADEIFDFVIRSPSGRGVGEDVQSGAVTTLSDS